MGIEVSLGLLLPGERKNSNSKPDSLVKIFFFSVGRRLEIKSTRERALPVLEVIFWVG